jgi:hypothetical protein
MLLNPVIFFRRNGRDAISSIRSNTQIRTRLKDQSTLIIEKTKFQIRGKVFSYELTTWGQQGVLARKSIERS